MYSSSEDENIFLNRHIRCCINYAAATDGHIDYVGATNEPNNASSDSKSSLSVFHAGVIADAAPEHNDAANGPNGRYHHTAATVTAGYIIRIDTPKRKTLLRYI